MQTRTWQCSIVGATMIITTLTARVAVHVFRSAHKRLACTSGLFRMSCCQHSRRPSSSVATTCRCCCCSSCSAAASTMDKWARLLALRVYEDQTQASHALTPWWYQVQCLLQVPK